MKKNIVFAILMITTTTTFGQQTIPNPSLSKQDYQQKSKHQKTAAWILVSGGSLCAMLGTIQFNFAGSDGEVNNSNSTVFLVTGLAAIGASIPFFIASSKNKKKAADISFRMEKGPQVQQGSFVFRSYPALSFRINL
ncbi:MAG: hypothetical protein IPI68_02885 [Chitinophagaceae bacterium]|nr:hypothetical protein [Chitinophagaceae bacterium]